MDTSAFNKTYNDISKRLLSSFAAEEGKGNVVLSPFSILLLLGIAADAAQGPAREEILRALDGVPHGELLSALSHLQGALAASGSLRSSNAVCVKEVLKDSIAAGYEARLREIFDGRLFTSRNMARDVNAWVEEKTDGMIRNAADASVEQALACLMNAVAFAAEWESPYWDENITDGRFHNADGSVSSVRMMRSRENSYVENAFFQGFVKPYKDRDYAFMALLPKNGNRSYLHKAIDHTDFTKLYSSAQFCDVNAAVPEFACDLSEDLTAFCRGLGIETLFGPEADFSPLAGERLWVDAIVHKAHIQVDRRGTKAAALTMGIVCGCALPTETRTIRLDRPFVYALVHTKTGLPVFMGLYSDASASNHVRRG